MKDINSSLYNIFYKVYGFFELPENYKNIINEFDEKMKEVMKIKFNFII